VSAYNEEGDNHHLWEHSAPRTILVHPELFRWARHLEAIRSSLAQNVRNSAWRLKQVRAAVAYRHVLFKRKNRMQLLIKVFHYVSIRMYHKISGTRLEYENRRSDTNIQIELDPNLPEIQAKTTCFVQVLDRILSTTNSMLWSSPHPAAPHYRR
jgi:hypothetical protein